MASELKGCWKLLATGFTKLPSQRSCPCQVCACCPGRPKPRPGGLPPRKLTGQGVCRLSGLRFAIKTPGTQGREQLELWAQGRRPTLEQPRRAWAKGRVSGFTLRESRNGERPVHRQAILSAQRSSHGARGKPGCQVLLEACPRLPCGPPSPLTKIFPLNLKEIKLVCASRSFM